MIEEVPVRVWRYQALNANTSAEQFLLTFS